MKLLSERGRGPRWPRRRRWRVSRGELLPNVPSSSPIPEQLLHLGVSTVPAMNELHRILVLSIANRHALVRSVHALWMSYTFVRVLVPPRGRRFDECHNRAAAPFLHEGQGVLDPRNTPRTFTAMIASKSSIGMSAMAIRLVIRRCLRGRRAVPPKSGCRPAPPSSRLTRHVERNGSRTAPARRMFRGAFRRSPSRSPMRTVAPSAATVSPISAPVPAAPPVMRATLFRSRMMRVSVRLAGIVIRARHDANRFAIRNARIGTTWSALPRCRRGCQGEFR